MRKRRIGFIIDDNLPSVKACLQRKCSPGMLLKGWPTDSANGFMRYGWMAQEVNRIRGGRYRYELFRPWHSYCCIVFLKSMGAQCRKLAQQLKKQGVRIVLDLNVDYFSWPRGVFFYDGMAPYTWQRKAAFRMGRIADAVSCASQHIATSVSRYHRRVWWVPDNVRPDLIAIRGACNNPFRKDGKLQLLWSGQAHKLFELLKIANVLKHFSSRIHLKIITGSLGQLERWYPSYGRQLKALLECLDCQVMPFTDIESLQHIYRKGGVFLSPRFLNNTYNRGHSEWKITLALAAGNLVLCSPQPSYCTVHQRSEGRAVRLCSSQAGWYRAFEEIFAGHVHWHSENRAATGVTARYYATPVIAAQHIRMLESIL